MNKSLICERNFEKKVFIKEGVKLVYHLSTCDSDKLLFIFPQGFRDFDFFITSKYKDLSTSYNVVIIDPYGRGESGDYKENNTLEHSAKNYNELIEELSFAPEEVTIFAKSLSSPIAEKMIELKPYDSLIIVMGPRFLYREMKRTIMWNIMTFFGERSFIFREFSRLVSWTLKMISNIKFSYFNWARKFIWYEIHDMIRFNKGFASPSSTQAFFILNKKDELFPTEESIPVLKRDYPKNKFFMLNHYTHWGPILDEEIEFMNKILK